MSIQFMAGFGNFRPEENRQCIKFDPFYTLSYGKCSAVLPAVIYVKVMEVCEEGLMGKYFKHGRPTGRTSKLWSVFLDVMPGN